MFDNLFDEEPVEKDDKVIEIPVAEVTLSDALEGHGEHGLGATVQEVGDQKVLMIPHVQTALEGYKGKNLLPVSIPEGVEPAEFQSCLTAAFFAYMETGRVAVEDVHRRLRGSFAPLSKERIAAIAATEQFGLALSYRGVNYNQDNGLLTPEQEAALMILTDIGSKYPFGKRLELAGISHAVYMAWMKNPAFARAMHGLAEQITENSSIALVELGRKVGEGDLQAVKLQLEINGRHNPQQQQTVDMLVVMNKILESLATHLAGKPEIFRLIAADMRQIATEAQSRPLVSNTLEF